MKLPLIDTQNMLDFLVGLLNTPSPAGFTGDGILYCEKALKEFPHLELSRTRKGALLATLPGESKSPAVALTAHVDTLGAMVKEIKPSGRLKLTQLGSFAWNSVEGEGCTVVTTQGKRIRGSILVEKASIHVYGRQIDLKREDDVMEVRLDETVTTADEVRTLGVAVGDFVVFDPRVERTNGFVRSRHLDDKAGVACLFAAIRALHLAGLTPHFTTHF